MVGLSSAVSSNYVSIINDAKKEIECGVIVTQTQLMSFVTDAILNETV